jgi:dCMP deaminase
VKDHSIVSTGYNGPPRGVPHCGFDRWMKDDVLVDSVRNTNYNIDKETRFKNDCPRRILSYESGTHMELCPAQHAEENAISNAARLGVSVLGSTLYMNCITPCKNCFGTLINAGILEIVVDDIKMYDRHTQFLVDNSTIKIRQFNL